MVTSATTVQIMLPEEISGRTTKNILSIKYDPASTKKVNKVVLLYNNL